jgi:hypothetical protein
MFRAKEKRGFPLALADKRARRRVIKRNLTGADSGKDQNTTLLFGGTHYANQFGIP